MHESHALPIFHDFFLWLSSIFSTEIIAALLAFICASSLMVEKNSSIIKIEGKILWHRVKAGLLSFTTPLSIPFKQNPFMLWIHPYPEWSRRFFVSDNYYTMKTGYHTGGTTKYLPCVFALYSKREKWLTGISAVLFFGITYAVLQANPQLLPLVNLNYWPLCFLACTALFFHSLWKDVWIPIILGCLAGAISILTNTTPPHTHWGFALAFIFPAMMFAYSLNVSILPIIFPLLGLLFRTFFLNQGAMLDIPYLAFVIISLGITIYFEASISRLKKKTTIIYGLFCLLMLPSLSVLYYYNSSFWHNDLWQAFIAFFYPAWAISSMQLAPRRYRLLAIVLYILALARQTHTTNIIQDNLSAAPYYLWPILSIFLCLVIVPALPAATKHICTPAKPKLCIGKLPEEGRSNKHLVQEYTFLITSFVFLAFLFGIKIIAVSSNDFLDGPIIPFLDQYKNVIALSFILFGLCNFALLFQHKKRQKTHIWNCIRVNTAIVSILGSAALMYPNNSVFFLLATSLILLIAQLIKKLYFITDEKEVKKRKLTDYVWSWVSFNIGLIILLNMTPPCKYIIFCYIGFFSFLIALFFFYFPKFFHTKGRRGCTNKLEYGIYLWPLGLRAWSLLFGLALSLPLYLFNWKYALTMLLSVTFFVPWFIYSVMRIPTLLDLWRGKRFYQMYMEGEASLTPTSTGLARFWPFRCLPFLPGFTNYRGGQSIRSSIYTRIALHEVISSKTISKSTIVEDGENYSFFLSLKWFWFCCIPIWSSFTVLLAITVFHSIPTGDSLPTQTLATAPNPLFVAINSSNYLNASPHLLGRYIFLTSGILWLILSWKMVSTELSRLSSLSSYELNQEGQAIVPLWIKSKAIIAAQDFAEIYKTQTQKIMKLTLGAFASIYCVILTFG